MLEQLVDGGELLVVCLDVKVAWPRTAAKPGRLQIAQLERARATLEGRLAEEATRHANLHVAFEELKAELAEDCCRLTSRTGVPYPEQRKQLARYYLRWVGLAAPLAALPEHLRLPRPSSNKDVSSGN